jgi:hypothetical protein
MSWLFSQVLVEEYLAANSLDGEQSVQLSGKPTQQAYCAPDKMTVFSRLSRFGMMFKPLTDIPGEELLMSSVVAFHARTLVPQVVGTDLTENDQECGKKWLASFTKYDPNMCLWKTHQCSLVGDLDEFSETWPQWGLMRDGECWEQRMLEQTTKGTEYGLLEKLPTPTCHNSKEGNYPAEHRRKTSSLAMHVGGKIHPMFTEWMMGWPLGWTDLKPLEMDKSHFVPQQLGEF